MTSVKALTVIAFTVLAVSCVHSGKDVADISDQARREDQARRGDFRNGWYRGQNTMLKDIVRAGPGGVKVWTGIESDSIKFELLINGKEK